MIIIIIIIILLRPFNVFQRVVFSQTASDSSIYNSLAWRRLQTRSNAIRILVRILSKTTNFRWHAYILFFDKYVSSHKRMVSEIMNFNLTSWVQFKRHVNVKYALNLWVYTHEHANFCSQNTAAQHINFEETIVKWQLQNI